MGNLLLNNMKTISKFVLAALMGNLVDSRHQPNSTIDIFADNIIDLLDMDVLEEVPDYRNYTTDLNKRRDEGKLDDTDAFKTMNEIAEENGFAIEEYSVAT